MSIDSRYAAQINEAAEHIGATIATDEDGGWVFDPARRGRDGELAARPVAIARVGIQRVSAEDLFHLYELLHDAAAEDAYTRWIVRGPGIPFTPGISRRPAPLDPNETLDARNAREAKAVAATIEALAHDRSAAAGKDAAAAAAKDEAVAVKAAEEASGADSLAEVSFASSAARDAAEEAGLVAADLKRQRKSSDAGFTKADVERIAADSDS